MDPSAAQRLLFISCVWRLFLCWRLSAWFPEKLQQKFILQSPFRQFSACARSAAQLWGAVLERLGDCLGSPLNVELFPLYSYMADPADAYPYASLNIRIYLDWEARLMLVLSCVVMILSVRKLAREASEYGGNPRSELYFFDAGLCRNCPFRILPKWQGRFLKTLCLSIGPPGTARHRA